MKTSSIQILDKGATQSLESIHNALAPSKRRPLMHALGRKAEKLYRAHFVSRDDDSPNRMGWKRQHFWSRLAKATAFDPSRTTDSSATVVISDRAINAKLYGGTWRARESGFLAIPLREEAYGTRPKANLITGLFFLRSRFGKGGGYLVKREGKKLMAFWRLVPRITVQSDPRTLPPSETVNAGLLQTAASFLMRATTKLNPPAPDS